VSPFQLTHLPLNVKVGRLLSRVPILRRWSGALRSGLFLPSEGSFRYGGKEIRFNGRNSQFHAIYDAAYEQGYEYETGALLCALLRGDGTFVDVGANWGYFTLLVCSQKSFVGTCVAYEPAPSTFEDLRSMVAQAGLSDRVRCRNVGVGSERGVLQLMASEQSGLAHLHAEGGGPSVEVVKLDDEPLSAVRVIKIDVEGMELEVLRGAEQTLVSHRPAVVLENFVNLAEPNKTLAPLEWLRARQYEIFAPMVRTGPVGWLHYGSPLPKMPEGAPELGFVRVSNDLRFALSDQLNLLAWPSERVADLPGSILK
jgi:FkbM family methyltransferase